MSYWRLLPATPSNYKSCRQRDAAPSARRWPTFVMLSCNARVEAYLLVANLRRGRPPCRPYASAHASSAETPLPPRPPRSAVLAGTVPYHVSYLLLHAPDPASTWPARFTSRVYLELQRRLKRTEHGGLVNFCWLGEQGGVAGGGGTEEVYHATLWRKSRSEEISRRLDIPIVSTRTLDRVVDLSLQRDMDTDTGHEEAVASSGPYFYVCTHGKRDCRCGTRGSDLLRDLQKELQSRGMLLDEKGRPRLGEVGHVGGHKNAPNMLVFPQGDWYGNLEAADLPGLVDHYVRCLKERPICSSVLTGPNRFQWRGRMGMTKREQNDVFHGRVWMLPETVGFLLE